MHRLKPCRTRNHGLLTQRTLRRQTGQWSVHCVSRDRCYTARALAWRLNLRTHSVRLFEWSALHHDALLHDISTVTDIVHLLSCVCCVLRVNHSSTPNHSSDQARPSVRL